MFVKLGLIVLTVSVALALPAQAQIYFRAQNIFGHVVSVNPNPGERKLTIDGFDVLEGGELYISDIALAGDVPIAIGSVGPGGSMCASVPFIVSFVAGETPKVDVLPEECGGLNFEIGNGEVTFGAESNPLSAMKAWRWTPAKGFVEIDAASTPTKSGWDELRSHRITAPSDFLAYEDLVQVIEPLVGSDRGQAFRSMYGPPNSEYDGNIFIGSNCLAHNCPFGGSLVIADIQKKAIYLAWKWPDEAVKLSPSISEWPIEYADRVNEWQAQW